MELDITAFRAKFPAYSDETAYPEATLNMWYETGKCYVKDNDCTLDEDCREYALMLMLAHLLFIQDSISSGSATKIITSASESDVSVSLAEPPSSSNFSYWLNVSPYGSQLIAMLEIAFAGGGWCGDGLERMVISGGY